MTAMLWPLALLIANAILRRRRYYPVSRATVPVPARSIRLPENHPTFVFIDEVVRQGRTCQQTTLCREMQSGARIRRRPPTGDTGRIRITTDAELLRYYLQITNLADSIAKHGIVDVEHETMFRSDPTERNIAVVIDAQGRLSHYRRGRHRLAIAHALDLQQVPVQVYADTIGGWWAATTGRREGAAMDARLPAIVVNAVVGEGLGYNCWEGLLTAVLEHNLPLEHLFPSRGTFVSRAE